MREEFVPEAHSQDLERSGSWRLPSPVFALSLSLLTSCDGLGPIDGEMETGAPNAPNDGEIPLEMLVEGCRGKDCIPALAEATSTRNRVLGIPTGDSGGVALPFEELRTEKDARVVRLDRPDTDVVVFWNQRYEAAMAFEARIGDESVSFTLVGEGVRDVIRDVKTGSVWTVEGLAVEGPLSGTRLEAVPNAYVAFKEAWKTFQPHARIWSNDE